MLVSSDEPDEDEDEDEKVEPEENDASEETDAKTGRLSPFDEEVLDLVLSFVLLALRRRNIMD